MAVLKVTYEDLVISEKDIAKKLNDFYKSPSPHYLNRLYEDLVMYQNDWCDYKAGKELNAKTT